MSNTPSLRVSEVELGICILAGGLSIRMRRDKAGVRLGGRTLLSHVRSTASGLGCGIRVIRRDRVARCGPLGGVFTGLATSRARAELFLACDMPFVSLALLEQLRSAHLRTGRSVFVSGGGRVGFPFILPRGVLEEVSRQIELGNYAIGALAEKLRARRVRARVLGQLININTPDELRRARLISEVVASPG